MVSSSVSTHRGPVHWQGLLLVVSLLNFWSLHITALMRVESTDALEGLNNTLPIRHQPRNPEYFVWFRGDKFDIYNHIAYLSVNPRSHVRSLPGGQVIVEDDWFLLLKNVAMKHSGDYTVLVQLQGCQKMIACGQLNVHPVVSVGTLVASNTSITENKDAVVFSCYTNHEDIKQFFEGKSIPLTERTKLSLDHRNLTIDPVWRCDSGYYQCKASNPRSSGKSALLHLHVKYDPLSFPLVCC